MTRERERILIELRDEFDRWEELLSTVSEEEITTSRLPNGWSIKDLMAHLMAWQQVTAARLKASLRNESPVFPEWLIGAGPESREDPRRFNARIFEIHRELPWPEVHHAWRAGFRRVLTLGERAPEDDGVDTGRHPWRNGQILQGTYDHHHVGHLGSLLTWMDEHRGGAPRYVGRDAGEAEPR